MAEFWSNNDRGYRIRLWIDQVSQDIQNNTSNVRIRLALLNQWWTFASYQCSGYVDGFGQRIEYSGSPSMLSNNSEIQLIDQTITVSHADDGTGVFGVHAHFNGSGGYSPGNLDIGNQSITLTTIPRGSTVSVPDGVIGSQVTITVNKKLDGATHKLRYSWFDKQGDIGDNVGTDYKWTIPWEFADNIPNSTSGRGTIYVDTYINGKFIQTQSTTFTASVNADSLKPSFTGFTLEDANATTQRIIPEQTHFVSIMSLIKVTFNGAQAQHWASITGYYAEIVGANNSITENGGVLREVSVNKETQMTLRGRVRDSRGVWSDWVEKKITFIFYFSPILSFEVIRGGSKSDTLTIKRYAKIAPLNVNGVQRNVMKLTFSTAKVGMDNFVIDNGQAGGVWSSISEFNASSANLGNTYPADTSYIVKGKLEDSFTSTGTEFQETVTTDKVVLTYDQWGIGVNKYRERGALDVNGDIYANNTPIQQYQLTNNNGSAKVVNNVNTIQDPGQYYVSADAPGNPNYQWGHLFHHSNNGSGSDNKEAIQIFYGNNGQLFFRHHFWSNKVDDWDEWIEFAQKNQPIVTKEIQIGYGVTANLVRQANMVTLSLIRGIHSVGVGEYAALVEKIPDGFKPSTTIHLVANKNVANFHTGCAVWHLESNGNIFISNPNSDNCIHTGTVAYITTDEYPTNVNFATEALNDLQYATQNNNFSSFDKKWAYSGTDLGFTYSQNRTTFKIWAPTATSVKLISYGKNTNPTAAQVSATSMTRGTSATPDNHATNTIGVWSLTVPGDQNGMVYAYELTFANGIIIGYANSDYGKLSTNYVVNITNDPYSIATTQGGKRSVVVSPESVKSNLVLAQGNSATWRVLSPTHAIVNEVHIRDFTISPTSGVSEGKRGKFLGVIQPGTTNPNTGTPTGLDYLKSEGFNYVQLMPVSQYSSVDESGNRTPEKPNNYNWGYDPQNEMVPAGIYASDSMNPFTRIIEMKQMIQGLHDNGIGVIMDMVFNHVSDQGDSPFEKSVPGYYFRRYSESGCGNDTASDREMFGKFIIDAVLYWAKNYDIDGFRFDLMSIIDTDTMNKLRAKLTEIDPHIITYGEGWGYPNANKISETSIKDPKKVPDIGFFNPTARDAIVNNEGHGDGFASGNTSKTTTVASALLGSGGWNGSTPLHDFWTPGQSVNYIECHDGWTLNELLWSANPNDSVDTHRKRVAFANAVIILANGITFMEAGQEFCRSKLVNPSNLKTLSQEEIQAYQSGSKQKPAWYSAAWDTAKNSYNGLFCLDGNGNYHGNYWPGSNLGSLIVAGDAVNGINWDNVKDNQKIVNFIGKMIKFKKSNPLFWWNDYRYSAWDSEKTGVEKVTNASNGVITEELGWESTRYLVVFNASGNSVKIGQGGQFYGGSDLKGKTVIISNDDGLTDNQVLNSSVTVSNLTVTIIKIS